MAADATFWNDIAAEYAAKPVELPEAFERKIAITRELLTRDSEVVEIGCGTGTLALRLAPHCRRIEGLDISTEMLGFARQKALAQGAGNVHFHEGAFDASAPFEPGAADALLAYSILHLVEDLDDALARAFSLLRPGGVLVSSTACLGDSWKPYGLIIAVMRWTRGAPYVRILRRAELLAAVEAAGFVDIELPDVGASPTTAFLVARRPAG